MNPSTAKKLLKMTKELYEKEVQSFSDTRKVVWEKEIIDFVSQIEPGSSVLDLGCGNGRFLALLRSKCRFSGFKNGSKRINYFGVDSSKNFIEMDRIRYSPLKNPLLSASFEVEDGLNLQYKNKFDYIICQAVLHHIPSKELQLKFLKNIHKALRANGISLIAVWNRHQNKYKKYFNKIYKKELINKYQQQSVFLSALISELDQNDLIVPWRQSGKFRYIHAFKPTELKQLAQRAGFKKIRLFASRHGTPTDLKTALNIYLIGKK